MTPLELRTYLDRLAEKRVPLAAMLWGPPGIGKSSIVAQIARRHAIGFVDLRLSQLAPTDLRGLPVPAGGKSTWLPPEFLPDGGAGILFLDEINLAPPALQGIAQQLILDRRVGSYVLPDGWLVWAAGNRKEDRASVYDMPAPLANRFLHLNVAPDLDSFKAWALETGLSDRIVAFLSFRPALLHKPDPQQSAWPSPRTWEMAGRLIAAGLDPAPAVGDGAAAELSAFEKVYQSLPDLERILSGGGDGVGFPAEASARYAVTVGLTARANTAARAGAALAWLVDVAGAEWVGLFAADLMRLLRSQGKLAELAAVVKANPKLGQFLQDYQKLLSA